MNNNLPKPETISRFARFSNNPEPEYYETINHHPELIGLPRKLYRKLWMRKYRKNNKQP